MMKNTIFLNLNGVLQHGGRQERFKIDWIEVQEKLTQTLKENYKSIDHFALWVMLPLSILSTNMSV